MMQIPIAYGQETVTVELTDERLAQIVEPNATPRFESSALVRAAFEKPVGAPSLGDFLEGAEDVLFIVNDGTRPTPTARTLRELRPHIDPARVRFMVATGIHRAPTEQEYRYIFGEFYDEFRSRATAHDARARDSMVYLGESANGTQMEVNRAGVDAAKIVIIGSVEPHYFAGYTGGRKSFLPGIASYRTIEQNHKHALSLDAKALALAGNPVHEDMVDALRCIAGKEIFSVMTVLDRDHNIYAAVCGDIHGAFEAAVGKADDVFSVPIKEKAEIVVSVAPFPMDIDLYQSQKALDNGKLALKQDGILILVSKCRTGVGNDDFVRLMERCKTPQEALAAIECGYVLGYHKAAKMAEIGLWAQTWAVADLDDRLLRSVFLKPYHDIQRAVDDALALKGPEAKVLFLTNGSITVPRLADTGRAANGL